MQLDMQLEGPEAAICMSDERCMISQSNKALAMCILAHIKSHEMQSILLEACHCSISLVHGQGIEWAAVTSLSTTIRSSSLRTAWLTYVSLRIITSCL